MKYSFKVNRLVPCKGDSMWTNTEDMKVKVTDITIEREEDGDFTYYYVWVKHNGPWAIYTDTGFEKGISELVTKHFKTPIKVCFTEQGMQKQHIASMEFRFKTCEKNYDRWARKEGIL